MAGVIDGFSRAIACRSHAPNLVLLASSAVVPCFVLGGLGFFNRMESAVANRL
jgi:hypothetical protein